MNIASRLAKLEADRGAGQGRQFTFIGGRPTDDLSAFASSFGVSLTPQDQVIHLTVESLGEPLSLSHCSDMAVTLAYVAKYGQSLVPPEMEE